MKFSYRNKLLIVKINILGRYYKFLIDTGSERSFLVTNNYLNRFRRPLKQRVNVKGVGQDKLIKYVYSIPQITIDNQIINETEFLIKGKDLMSCYLGIDGILGWDILKRFNFLIDFKNKIFTVCDIEFQKSYPYVSISPGQQLVVQVGYDNNKINALIDLGANNTVISEGILSNMEFIKWRRNIVFGINGIFIRKIPEISNLIIDFGNKNIIINNVNIKTFKYNWLLKFGTDIFQDHKVYFNNLEREVLIIE